VNDDDLWLEVMAAAEERRQKGLRDYGRPVSVSSDLDWLAEAEAELLDGAVYLRAARRRWEQLQAEVETLRRENDRLKSQLEAKS
jgi:hypothetical protein